MDWLEQNYNKFKYVQYKNLDITSYSIESWRAKDCSICKLIKMYVYDRL